MGQQSSQYTLAKKIQVLDEYAAGELTQAQIADKHKVSSQSVYIWHRNEKAIRAAYAKDQKQAEKANGASSNGANGHAKSKVKPASEETPAAPKLQILGLTPLIKELVKDELKVQLPALVNAAVKQAIDEAFSGKRSN